MRILVVHDHIGEAARPDEADDLVQARAVCEAIDALGHESMMLGLTLDLDEARQTIEHFRPDLIFNLVESLGGMARLIHVPAHLFDALHIPYTAAPAEALMLTSHKTLAKRLMRDAGIPTAAWITADSAESATGCRVGGRWIIKSVWEHASVGLDEDSVMHVAAVQQVREALAARAVDTGGDWFAEEYIEGREFNVALLCDTPASPKVLPPAEIVFRDYPPEKLKVVGYRAKWDEESFEYQHTDRRFDFPESDGPLLERLKSIALQCWRTFNLRGHARVDFRVDHSGQPWVLEVNANPCLSPDSGFAAMLDRAGIAYASAISRIIDDAIYTAPSPHVSHSPDLR
jgi:D-alanine-D-alanine ligase